MALRIPKVHERALGDLVQLPDDSRDTLVQVLTNASPTLRLRDLEAEVVARVGIDEEKATRILRLLMSLYAARSSVSVLVDDFVNQVCHAMSLAEDLSKKLVNIEMKGIRELLARLLSLDATLGVTSRALDVINQHEHVICASRILTDVRYVFPNDVHVGPSAAVCVHSLKVSYHEGSIIKDFYVALDASDLTKLRETLDRAIAKTMSIKKSLEKTGIPFLES